MPRSLDTVFSPKCESWVLNLDAADPRVTRVNIVGAKHRGIDQENTSFRGSLRLVEEPENPHDRNAIKVFRGEMHIGYVEKYRTANFHGRWDTFKQNTEWSKEGTPKVVSGIGWTIFIVEFWR